MRKRFYSILLSVSVLTAAVFAADSPGGKKTVSRRKSAVEIKVVPVGLNQDRINRIKHEIENSAAVKKELGATNYGLISFEYVSKNEKTNASELQTPKHFRIIFYDYTNDRAIAAEGALSSPETVRITEDAAKPNPSRQELDAAFELIGNSGEFGAALKTGKLRLFQAMPPVSVSASGERLINVGVESLDDSIKNEVVSISFKRKQLVRYERLAPPASSAKIASCGITNAGQPSTGRGVAGQYHVSIIQNGASIWEMQVTRPSASSGFAGSGIELQNVKYRGKTVFKQAHVPVLNVKYAGDACGPYVDWQYDEGFFDAPETGATNPAPGIRILASGQVAKTSLENGDDRGNFQGVAIYTQDVGAGLETVLVTEMDAGWYRYIMEWRFANDGTIRPRFGFGATRNSCVCLVHYHHVYWRFDFDVVNPNNRIYTIERGRKFLVPVTGEKSDFRNYQTNKSLLVQNGSGSEAYLLVPNLTDGRWNEGDSAFGAGDFWFLKYAPNNSQLGDTLDSAIDLTPYLNSESIDNQDNVVWYAAHFTHSDGANLLDPNRNGLTLSGSHVVGPDIRPVRW
jgi:hypothetical protein